MEINNRYRFVAFTVNGMEIDVRYPTATVPYHLFELLVDQWFWNVCCNNLQNPTQHSAFSSSELPLKLPKELQIEIVTYLKPKANQLFFFALYSLTSGFDEFVSYLQILLFDLHKRWIMEVNSNYFNFIRFFTLYCYFVIFLSVFLLFYY